MPTALLRLTRGTLNFSKAAAQAIAMKVHTDPVYCTMNSLSTSLLFILK